MSPILSKPLILSGRTILCLVFLASCKTPPPDLRPQKLIQVAVLLNYEHPSVHRNVLAGLADAMRELTQVNAVVFGQPPETQFDRREAKLNRNIKSNYLEYGNWKKEQIQQIISQGFDILVLFGDELPDLNESLRAVRQAGLFIIYCGFSRKPLILREGVVAPRSATGPYPEGSRNGILNESADQTENDRVNPGADASLPYLTQGLEEEAVSTPLHPAAHLNDHQALGIPAGEGAGQAEPGLVHINIQPASLEAVTRMLTQFMLNSTTGTPELNETQGPAGTAVEAAQNMETRRPARSLLLFGPSELPATRRLYRQMSPSIRKNRDMIQAVRFLDPLRIDAQNQLRQLVLDLPADGRIIVLEPLLLYSSSQILQRYGLGLKVAGLGWLDSSDPLLASGNIQLLIPLQYEAMAYASLYAAFLLYSGQKQGRSGEYFLLGRYGQRQVGPEGSLTIAQAFGVTQSQASSPPGPRTPNYLNPSRSPRNPRHRTILSEDDLRY